MMGLLEKWQEKFSGVAKMKYVNLTPRWTEILPTWLMMLEQSITGDCTNPDLVKENAKTELRRMAQGADNYNDLLAFVRAREDWTDKAVTWALEIGREIQENERTTVRESSDA
jgi:hypothetical protein